MIEFAAPVYCRVPSLACIRARGDDADDFLRRQLTQDPPSDEARFVSAAWCDAKGRVSALFDVASDGASLLLAAERDGLDDVLAKLRMYVLRSSVELAVDETCVVGAIVGDADETLRSAGIELAPDRGAACRAGNVLALRVGPGLVRLVGPADELERIRDGLDDAPPEAADIAEIRLGLPRVAGLRGRYVPQMLGLDRLGAVSFTKGCYPGQEVVARLHHLGSVKRRLRRFVGETPEAAEARKAPETPAPGTPLVDTGGTAIGEVVRAACADGRLEVLAVVPVDAAGAARVGVPEGPALEPASLPYERPEESVP